MAGEHPSLTMFKFFLDASRRGLRDKKSKPTLSEVQFLIASGAPYLFSDEVEAAVRFSDTTIWRLERAGQFPKRRKITASRVGWRTADIAAFVKGEWQPDRDAA